MLSNVSELQRVLGQAAKDDSKSLAAVLLLCESATGHLVCLLKDRSGTFGTCEDRPL